MKLTGPVRFLGDTRGATAVEYLVLVGAVALAGVVAFGTLGDNVESAFLGGSADAPDSLPDRSGDDIGGASGALGGGPGSFGNPDVTFTHSGTPGGFGDADGFGGDSGSGSGDVNGFGGVEGTGNARGFEGVEGVGAEPDRDDEAALSDLSDPPPVPVDLDCGDPAGHARTLRDHWDDVRDAHEPKPGDRIDTEDLIAIADDPSVPSDLRRAARFFLDNRAVLHVLERGGVAGDDNGRIGRDDLDTAITALDDVDWRAFREGLPAGATPEEAQAFIDRFHVIADVAAGRGSVDGDVSHRDIRALLEENACLGAGGRAAGEAWLDGVPDVGGCGTFDVGCHLGNAWDGLGDAASTVGDAWSHAHEWRRDVRDWGQARLDDVLDLGGSGLHLVGEGWRHADGVLAGCSDQWYCRYNPAYYAARSYTWVNGNVLVPALEGAYGAARGYVDLALAVTDFAFDLSVGDPAAHQALHDGIEWVIENPDQLDDIAIEIGRAQIDQFEGTWNACVGDEASAQGCSESLGQYAPDVAIAILTDGSGTAAARGSGILRNGLSRLRPRALRPDAGDIPPSAATPPVSPTRWPTDRITRLADDNERYLDDLFEGRPDALARLNDGPVPPNCSRSVNCSFTTRTVDSLLDGSPASAMPIVTPPRPGLRSWLRQRFSHAPPDQSELKDVRRIWEDLGARWNQPYQATDLDDALRFVESMGPGQHGTVYIRYPDGGAHIFNYVNDGGQARFLEGQLVGNSDGFRNLQHVDPESSIWLMPTGRMPADDLPGLLRHIDDGAPAVPPRTPRNALEQLMSEAEATGAIEGLDGGRLAVAATDTPALRRLLDDAQLPYEVHDGRVVSVLNGEWMEYMGQLPTSGTLHPVPGVGSAGRLDGAGALNDLPAPSGARPHSFTPDGAGRNGALHEALRREGIPTSQTPSRTLPNVDRRGNPQPGYIYEYVVDAPGGGMRTVRIRDDAGGHYYGQGNPQNRGPHFNDESGRHYDYE